jgi:hypothetical protein
VSVTTSAACIRPCVSRPRWSAVRATIIWKNGGSSSFLCGASWSFLPHAARELPALRGGGRGRPVVGAGSIKLDISWCDELSPEAEPTSNLRRIRFGERQGYPVSNLASCVSGAALLLRHPGGAIARLTVPVMLDGAATPAGLTAVVGMRIVTATELEPQRRWPLTHWTHHWRPRHFPQPLPKGKAGTRRTLIVPHSHVESAARRWLCQRNLAPCDAEIWPPPRTSWHW